MSGTDTLTGVVLAVATSPALVASALVGRRLKLASTWYDITANTTDSITIGGTPPGDGSYAWIVGGAPLAGDDQTIATGQTVTFDPPVVDGISRAPATSGVLGNLTFSGTGNMAATIAENRELHVASIVAGTATGSIMTSGSTSGKTFDIHATSVTGGTAVVAYAIWPAHTNSTLRLHTTTLSGGSNVQALGVVGNYGPTTIDGNVEGVAGRVTIIGGSQMEAFGLSTNAYVRSSVIVTGGDIKGSTTSSASGIGSTSQATIGVICVDCDFYDSANAVAVSGFPVEQRITDRANFDSHVNVKLNGGGAATVRFVVLPDVTKVVLDTVLCSGGAGYLGTLASSIVDSVGSVTAAPGILDSAGARTTKPGILNSTGARTAYGVLTAAGVRYAEGVLEGSGTIYWTIADTGSTPYGNGEDAQWDADVAAVAAQLDHMTTDVVNLLSADGDGTLNMGLYTLLDDVKITLNTNKDEMIAANTDIQAAYSCDAGTAVAGGGGGLLQANKRGNKQ